MRNEVTDKKHILAKPQSEMEFFSILLCALAP